MKKSFMEIFLPGLSLSFEAAIASERRFTSNISQKFMLSPLALHFELSHNKCYGLPLLMTDLFTQVQLLLIWPPFGTQGFQ